jgi:nicotinamide-nucleotide amidase
MRAPHRTIAVLSIGDELTLGQTLDTNGKWISARFADEGVITVERCTVPDDLDAQVHALKRLATHADLIVCSGGLGPTKDDLTRQALAQAMDDTLVEDAIALAQIEAWYTARNRTMGPLNRLQALRPSRGGIMPNPHGTAPGITGCIKVGERLVDVCCVPGPPKEMTPMIDGHVLPRLRRDPQRVIRTRTLHTAGIAESELAQRLGNLMDRDRNPLVGTTASGGVVSCRLRFEGDASITAAEEALDATERQIRSVAGEYVFGAEQQTLAGVVIDMLRTRGHTLATCESCTGGLVSSLLTDVAGSSSVFAGGFVTYSNVLKSQLAGVDASVIDRHGAVSSEVAREMAHGTLRRLSATHAIAITGIAGPSGAVPAGEGRAAKPVGLVYIALASIDGDASAGAPAVQVRAFQFVGDRSQIREWSVRMSLVMLYQRLVGVQAKLLRELAS